MPWTRALRKQRFGPWKSVQANLQKSCWQLPYTVFLVGPWSHSSSGQGRALLPALRHTGTGCTSARGSGWQSWGSSGQ